ncbi:MFS transporter [Geovibrio thiophilus]|uniref:MFS transporter n=1 Tax=Geovibrio thiophilus TaxID=139438 RepID=A0A3R5X278_9BACT|nr:MFS transporter [Geovibrio thiophilus]QAR32676.1 MFS transporter [Geovibrio thiophilus]
MQKKIQRNNFILLFTINFLITFCFAVNDSFFPIFYKPLSSNALIFGLAFTLYSVSKILLSPAVGKLLDKYRADYVLLLSLFIYTAVSCLLCFVHNPAAILVIRIMQGTACAMFRPVIYYLLNIGLDGKRGRVMGMFDLSFYSALAIAPITGGFLLSSFDFVSIFLLMIFCCSASVILFVCFFNIASLVSGKNGGCTDPNLSMGLSVYLVMFYIFCRGWGISTVAVFLPLILNRADISPAKTGIVLSAATASTALLLPFTGRLADLFHKRSLIVVGGAAVSLLIPAFNAVSDYSHFLLLAVFSGIFSAISQPASSALVIEQVPKSQLGYAMGKFNVSLAMGFSCAPLFGQMVSPSGDPAAALMMSAALGVLSALFVLLYPIKTEKKVLSFE